MARATAAGDGSDDERSLGARYVAFIARRHRGVIGVSVALALLGVGGVLRLELEPGLKELLPSGDESARALDEAHRRVGEMSTLVLTIESNDAQANLDYARALAPRIEALGPALVERAIYSAPSLREFFQRNRMLFADEGLLTDLRDRARREVLGRENPLFVDLGDPPSLDALSAKVDALEQRHHLPGGALANDSGTLLAMVVLPARSVNTAATSDDQRLLSAVQKVVEALPPSSVRPGAGIRLRYAGEVQSSVEERRAVAKDVALTSSLVVGLVSLVVVLYFGRARALPLVALPALLGADLAMGLCGYTVGALNASTAFLGGIIVGNGINYPILQLARYQEELGRGVGAARALEVAVRTTARPTALAAFAASLSYGSLALTRFRGFNQFGTIGALGMAICWLFTMTLLPAVLYAIDARPNRRAKNPMDPLVDGKTDPAADHRIAHRINYGTPFAVLTQRFPMAVLALGAALTAGSSLALPRWLSDPFEYDFRKLRSVDKNGAQAGPSLDEILGRALSPSLVLTGSQSQSAAAKQVIEARGKREQPNPVAHVITVEDLLGGPADVVARKVELIDEIRVLLRPDKISLLPISDERKQKLLGWLPRETPKALTLADLPSLALRPFTERDGTVGRVVLVYPPQRGFSSWNGRDLFRLARVIRAIPVPATADAPAAVLHASGRSVIFASMVQAIARDGPMATGVSLAGVTLLTVALLGLSSDAVAVLCALCLGVLWMLGITAASGLKLNFLNFIALPITFGIGVDYAANVMLRYRLEGRGSMTRVLRSTGGAVMLNSATTIIGYGALLLAQNRALRSFGALAILGEAACVCAALLVVPSLLTLRDRRTPVALADSPTE